MLPIIADAHNAYVEKVNLTKKISNAAVHKHQHMLIGPSSSYHSPEQ